MTEISNKGLHLLFPIRRLPRFICFVLISCFHTEVMMSEKFNLDRRPFYHVQFFSQVEYMSTLHYSALR